MIKYGGEIITKEKHPEIYDWLLHNINNYDNNNTYFTLTKEDKINVYHDVLVNTNVTEIKHPFGYVSGIFTVSDCKKLTSLKGCPEEVGRYFNCSSCNSIISLDGAPKKIEEHFNCISCIELTSFTGFPKYVKGSVNIEYNNFSHNPFFKERYNLYVNMWFELLESVSVDEKIEYFNNYKDKKERFNNMPMLPIEVVTMIENELKIKKILENG